MCLLDNHHDGASEGPVQNKVWSYNTSYRDSHSRRSAVDEGMVGPEYIVCLLLLNLVNSR